MAANPGPAPMDTGEFIQCRICGKRLCILSGQHLRKHLMTAEEYKRRYGVGCLAGRNIRERISVGKSKGRRPYVARDPDEILEALRQHAEVCSPLSYNHIRKLDLVLATQAERAFGSWRAALKAAGVRRCDRQDWPAETVLRALEARRKAGKPMNAAALQSQDNRLHGAAVRRFGSYKAALERLGVDYDQVKRLHARDDQTYRRDLLGWCAKHGPLSPKGLLETDPNLYQTATKKHGGLKEVASKFGLPYRAKRKRWTRETVAEELRRIHRTHGPLGGNMLRAIDGALYQAARSHYGSLQGAAGELLLPFQRVQKSWDRNEVLRAIRQRAKDGKSLASQVVKQEQCSLLEAAYRHFGAWTKAKEAAGMA